MKKLESAKKRILILPLAICMTSSALADILPREGTDVSISRSEQEKFLPWAENLRKDLMETLGTYTTLPFSQRAQYLSRRMIQVTKDSGFKKYQTYMRVSINRGLELSDILRRNCRKSAAKESMLSEVLRRNRCEISVQETLVSAINNALYFYRSDLEQQNKILDGKKTEINYAANGSVIAAANLQFTNTISDASSQYAYMYRSLQYLRKDLYMDSHAANYSREWQGIIGKDLDQLPRIPAMDDISNIFNRMRLNRTLEKVVDSNPNIFSSINSNWILEQYSNTVQY